MALHGVALVDKPAGMSSFSVVSRIRRAFRSVGVTKAGHTGTLDPLATGLLPICVGEATKFAQRLLDSDKGYRASVQFGTSTTTGDAEGEIVGKSEAVVTEDALRAALLHFTGLIRQTPPQFSALKINGKPAYEYARAGQTVEIASREVQIYSIALLAFDVVAQRADIDVLCSKGTYIRSLAVDLALAAGSVGHLASLRRTRTGGFDLAAAQPLDAWMEASDEQRVSWLLPTEALVADLPEIRLDAAQTIDLRNGKLVGLVAGGRIDEPLVRAYGVLDGSPAAFLGLGRVDAQGVLRAERLLSTH